MEKRIKNLEPIVKIIPHIMKARHDSQNLFKYEVLCDSIDKFIVEQRENEEKSFFIYACCNCCYCQINST